MRDRAETAWVVQTVFSALWQRPPLRWLPGSLGSRGGLRQRRLAQFLAFHGVVCNTSRRGNCRDNAPLKSFLSLLERARIRRRLYPTKDAVRAEVFDDMELFYNPKRRHGSTGDLSPVEFEWRDAQTGA